MTTYLVVKVKEKDPVTPLQRKKYITSLYGEKYNTSKEVLGFFQKFSYALGYKKHQENFDYVTPYDIVIDMFYPHLDGETVFDFYIPKGETTAFDNSYSFENGEIGRKWANFLSKVFPELEVSIEVTHELPERSTWLSSYFFKCIEDFPVTIETSIATELNEKEIAGLKKVIEIYKDEPLKFKILQYKCDTCKEHNPDYPIHLSLEYWWNEEESKKNHEKYELKYNGPYCVICGETSQSNGDLCETCNDELKNKIILEIN